MGIGAGLSWYLDKVPSVELVIHEEEIYDEKVVVNIHIFI
jgi:hypothetical protein